MLRQSDEKTTEWPYVRTVHAATSRTSGHGRR